MKWITLQRPQMETIACSWLIIRFIDPDANIVYVEHELLTATLAEKDVIPFNIKGSSYTARHDECLFDVFIQKHHLTDPALQEVANIVRGAATSRFHLTPQSSGLRAIAAGMAHNEQNDQALLQQSMVIYDAVYSWARHVRKPLLPDAESKLMEVFHRFITQKYADRAKKPEWVKEIAAFVQDDIDTNLSLDLAGLAERLKIDPGGLAKHPDHHAFGEEIRRLRMEKAMQLMEEDIYSLSEIAYMTGFSDQGHFSRIFGKHYGKTPTGHLKTIRALKEKEEEE
ncbi:chromate resistance protein ChrB domain-containing protein [Chitinophaga sp. 22620]|uniref:chromate resistance protein ChrB domain-containing protein n=1 Tax=Chitinophaga sp. 22620 TaxID=3453952 RepID=UPI003F8721BD